MPSVETYGWASSEEPRSCGYISDEIIVILKKLGIRRVLDVGAGNGTLCHEMSRAGFEVVGRARRKNRKRILRWDTVL